MRRTRAPRPQIIEAQKCLIPLPSKRLRNVWMGSDHSQNKANKMFYDIS